MISRGEVGLIVTAMGASTGIFKQPEVAVMVTVVLLTTLFTPLIMRGAFAIHCAQDDEDDQNGVEEQQETNSVDYAPMIESSA